MKTIDEIEVEVYVKLADKTMKLSELTHLKKGDVIAFNKPVNLEVELFANNKKIAEGEVVVVDGNFGFQITKI